MENSLDFYRLYKGLNKGLRNATSAVNRALIGILVADTSIAWWLIPQ